MPWIGNLDEAMGRGSGELGSWLLGQGEVKALLQEV